MMMACCGAINSECSQLIWYHTKSRSPSEACVLINIPPPPPSNNATQHSEQMHIIARTMKQSLSQTSIPMVLTPLARQRRNTLCVTSRISCIIADLSGAKATNKYHMVDRTGKWASRHSHKSHRAPQVQMAECKT